MKKLLIYSVFACFLGLISCQNVSESEDLSLEWETKGFETPESIIYYEPADILFVSNIGGSDPSEKDGNGFISKLKTDGKIAKLKWVEDLNSPKGMAVSDGFLYVTDIDHLIKIDIEKSEVVQKFEIEDAVFLNDIIELSNGELLISDSKSMNFVWFKDGEFEKVLQDDSFSFPNGMTKVGDNIFAGVGDKIIKVNPDTWTYEDYISETVSVDGIALLDDQYFIISDWQGRVERISQNDKKLLLNTTEANINVADFHFDQDTKKIYIPTFYHNTVSCYKVK